MDHQYPNVVLIGMPGAGKSTVGVILAKQLSYAFLDTDILIQTLHGRGLQDIVDREGHLVLRSIEEQVLLGIDVSRHVIATGGSAAYSEKAMQHLGRTGRIVFLDVSLPELQRRIHDFSRRGLAKRPEQTFDDLFHERLVLYRSYADVTISCTGLNQDEVCARIYESLPPA
ncbi:MAG: shikimate kinase [Kiritimatiellia bacterium]|nr:shikimate kinase [Lentisphaerota bacterium]